MCRISIWIFPEIKRVCKNSSITFDFRVEKVLMLIRLSGQNDHRVAVFSCHVFFFFFLQLVCTDHQALQFSRFCLIPKLSSLAERAPGIRLIVLVSWHDVMIIMWCGCCLTQKHTGLQTLKLKPWSLPADRRLDFEPAVDGFARGVLSYHFTPLIKALCLYTFHPVLWTTAGLLLSFRGTDNCCYSSEESISQSLWKPDCLGNAVSWQKR